MSLNLKQPKRGRDRDGAITLIDTPCLVIANIANMEAVRNCVSAGGRGALSSISLLVKWFLIKKRVALVSGSVTAATFIGYFPNLAICLCGAYICKTDMAFDYLSFASNAANGER